MPDTKAISTTGSKVSPKEEAATLVNQTQTNVLKRGKNIISIKKYSENAGKNRPERSAFNKSLSDNKLKKTITGDAGTQSSVLNAEAGSEASGQKFNIAKNLVVDEIKVDTDDRNLDHNHAATDVPNLDAGNDLANKYKADEHDSDIKYDIKYDIDDVGLPPAGDDTRFVELRIPGHNKPYVLGGKEGNIEIANIKFAQPTKPLLRRHVVKSSGFFSLGGAAWVGAQLGLITGSAAPGIGNIVGTIVGFLGGLIIGKALSKIAYRNSHERIFDKTMKAFADQGIKFTEAEKKNLEKLDQDDLDYFLEKSKSWAVGVRGLTKSGSKTQMRVAFMQCVFLEVARNGTEAGARFAKSCDASVNLAILYGQGSFKQRGGQEIDRVLREFEKRGGNYDVAHDKIAGQMPSVWRKETAKNKHAKDWQNQLSLIKNAFGQKAHDRIAQRQHYYKEHGVSPYYNDKNYPHITAFDECVTAALDKQKALFDPDVHSKVEEFARSYVAGARFGMYSPMDFCDTKTRLTQSFRNELFNKAVALQTAKRGPGSVSGSKFNNLRNEINLPYHLRGLRRAAGPNGSAMDASFNYFDQSKDVFADCEVIKRTTVEDLANALKRGHGKPSANDIRAAKNLRNVAKLGAELKNTGKVSPDVAQMMLRREMDERRSQAGNPVKGWMVNLFNSKEDVQPDQTFLAWAKETATAAGKIHKSFAEDSQVQILSHHRANRIAYQVRKVLVYRHSDHPDHQAEKMLAEKDFRRLKLIVTANANVGRAMHAIFNGAASTQEAIDCAFLGISPRDVRDERNKMSNAEYREWLNAGFSPAEIAEYQYCEFHVVDGISPDDPNFKTFAGSHLSKDQINTYRKMGLKNYSKSPARHRRGSIVMQDEFLGGGSYNQVRKRVVNVPSGDETRVYKSAAFTKSSVTRDQTVRALGANLGAVKVDKALGFNCIADTQVTFNGKEIGSSMSLAKGHTMRDIKKGIAYLAVPKGPGPV